LERFRADISCKELHTTSQREHFVVPLYVKSKAFKRSIQAAQFREAVVGSALARKFNLLFQPSPHPPAQDHSKTCDFGLLDPIKCNAWRVELQCCWHLNSIENGKFAFELNTHDDDGSIRPGKLRYCDADWFVYNAPKMEQLFLFNWIPLKELILDLYDQNKVDVLSYDQSTWKHDSNPIDLILISAGTILAEKGVKTFTYEQLNIPNILLKTYEL
jgi:hypothetical protein